MIGIDTNILLRIALADDESQVGLVAAVREAARDHGVFLHINLLVLCETVWVLARTYRQSRDAITGFLLSIVSTEEFDVESRSVVLATIEHCRSGTAGFADALIALGNARDGCTTTLTFDRKAARLPEFQLLT